MSESVCKLVITRDEHGLWSIHTDDGRFILATRFSVYADSNPYRTICNLTVEDFTFDGFVTPDELHVMTIPQTPSLPTPSAPVVSPKEGIGA